MTMKGSTAGAGEAFSRRALRVLAALIAGAVVLVATHRGEFWPFSTYSMFARAGRPWHRALVRVVDGAALVEPREYALDRLPGAPLPLEGQGIPQNDLSSLVQRVEVWESGELAAFTNLFGSLPCEAPLLVLRVSGALEAGGIHVVATPAVAIRCEAGEVRVERLVPESS